MLPELPQIRLMLKPKYLPAALLIFVLAFRLGVGVSRAEGVTLAVANIQSLSLAVSPLVPRAAQGEHTTVVVSIDSTGVTNATLYLASPNWPQSIKQAVPSLPKGKHAVEVEIAPLAGSTPVTVSVESDGRTDRKSVV